MKVSLCLLAGLALMGMSIDKAVAEQESNINIDLAQKTGKVMNTPARLQKALAKYNLNSRVSPSRLNMAASTIDLSSVHVDVEYVGTIGVGNPPQYFQMDFDTGSADIWIPHVGCSHCGKHPLFDPSESSTFTQDTNQTWGLRYGDGSGVQGIIGRDTVHLGDLSHPNQVLGLVQGESADLALDPELDGIFGLAYSPLAFTGQKQSIVEGMRDSGMIPAAKVGVYLGRARDGGKGELSFGRANPDHYEGELVDVPVTKKKFWQVSLNGLKINGEETLSKPIDAIIDTGTTLIILPSELAESIHATIPGATFSSMYGWRMPCGLKASAAGDKQVVFTLGDHDFALNASDLVRERASPSSGDGEEKLCYSGIAEAKTPMIIMGDTFLRSFYSVYDFDRDVVSFARAKP